MARDRDEWLRRWPASPRPDDVFAADEVGVAGVMASITDTPSEAVVQDRGGAIATQAPTLPGWSVDEDAPGSPAGSIRPPDTAPRETDGAERPRGAVSLIAVALIASLFGGGIGTAVTLAVTGDDAVTTTDGTDAGPQVTAPTVDLGDFEGTNVVSAVAAAVTPSVVRIDILADGANGVAQEVGLGSGEQMVAPDSADGRDQDNGDGETHQGERRLGTEDRHVHRLGAEVEGGLGDDHERDRLQ